MPPDLDGWPRPGDKVCFAGNLIPDAAYLVVSIILGSDDEAALELQSLRLEVHDAILHGWSTHTTTYFRAKKGEIIILEKGKA